MKMRVVLALFMLVSFAYAAILPNNSTYVGTSKSIQINSVIASVGGGGGGGQFDGTVAGFDTSFWCVDSQLQVSIPSGPGLANVILLNDISTTNTQYGDVTNGPGPSWTNQLINGDLLLGDAASRYEMVAYMISQYVGFDATIDTGAASAAKDTAIQDAIWATLNNNTPGTLTGTSAISTIGGDTTTGYWVHQAFLNKGSVIPQDWAVVSWVVNPNGTLSTPMRQTFLVQVDGGVHEESETPEPSTMLLLGTALAGIAMLRRRRLVR